MNQKYEEEISLKDFLRIIFKMKRVIFIVFIITTILSCVYAYAPVFEKEIEYEASSSISIVYNYITPDNAEEIGEGYVYYQDRQQNIMVPTINGYAHSFSILRAIITDLDLRDKKGEYIKANNLLKDITIENQNGSNLMMITVKYKNSEIAEDIANEIPQKLIQMSKSNPDLTNYKINIIDYAIATETEQSNKLIIAVIGMLLGLILGVFIAFTMNYLSKKIQTSSQVRFMGLEIDLVVKAELDIEKMNKLIALAKLTDAKTVIIGVEDLLTSSISLDFIKRAKNDNVDVELLSYVDDEFLLKVKKIDKAFIIVQEDKSEIWKLDELARLVNKYNINIAVIYIEK